MASVYGLLLANSTSQAVPGATPTYQAMTSTTHGNACIFFPRTTDAITHIFLRAGVRTGTPPSYIGALESVDTSTGNPTGTVLGGGSPASVVFTPPADTSWDNTGQWLSLANSYSPADLVTPLAITFRYSSGTVDASNNLSMTRFFANLGPTTQVPYNNALTSGSWSKNTTYPIFGYKTASEVFGMPTIGGYATNISTNGHRQCLKWTPPTAWGTSITVQGISVPMVRHGSSGGSYRVGIWDASGTELRSSGTLATNVSANPTNPGTLRSRLSATYTLTTGTTYYFGFQNDSTQSAGIAGYRFASAADRACLPYGTDKALSTWDGSSWTDDTTVVPVVDIITDSIAFPTGSGIVSNPGFGGGFNG